MLARRVDRRHRSISGSRYHIKDAAQMKKAFADHNIAKESAQCSFNYDPLKAPLRTRTGPPDAGAKL